MAKKSTYKETIEVEITPREIAKALDGISEWIRGVRSTVLKLDPNSTVKLERPVPHTMAAVPMADGCPPPDPCPDPEKPGKPPHRQRRPRPRK